MQGCDRFLVKQKLQAGQRPQLLIELWVPVGGNAPWCWVQAPGAAWIVHMRRGGPAAAAMAEALCAAYQQDGTSWRMLTVARSEAADAMPQPIMQGIQLHAQRAAVHGPLAVTAQAAKAATTTALPACQPPLGLPMQAVPSWPPAARWCCDGCKPHTPRPQPRVHADATAAAAAAELAQLGCSIPAWEPSPNAAVPPRRAWDSHRLTEEQLAERMQCMEVDAETLAGLKAPGPTYKGPPCIRAVSACSPAAGKAGADTYMQPLPRVPTVDEMLSSGIPLEHAKVCSLQPAAAHAVRCTEPGRLDLRHLSGEQQAEAACLLEELRDMAAAFASMYCSKAPSEQLVPSPAAGPRWWRQWCVRCASGAHLGLAVAARVRRRRRRRR